MSPRHRIKGDPADRNECEDTEMQSRELASNPSNLEKKKHEISLSRYNCPKSLFLGEFCTVYVSALKLYA